MKPIDLDYQPPDEAERKRLDQPISPASVVAGGFLGLFFGPFVWTYATGLISGYARSTPPLVADIVAAILTVTLAVLAGRHIERTMPDARGMAVGIYVSAAVVAIGCVAAAVLIR